MTDSAIPFEAPFLAMTEGSLVPADPESRLAEHVRRLSRLFRAAGHDLRGPLHSMALQLELLRQSSEEVDNAELRERQGRYAAAVAKEISRLARMLESLWGGAEDGGEHTRFDLRETTEEIRAMAEPHFRREQIALAFQIPETAVEAEGSRAAARHAGLDLLLHAADRVPGGEVTLSVERRDPVAVFGVTAMGRNGVDARENTEEHTEEAPFAADRIARRLGGTLRATRPGERSWRWELELPRPRTPESDKENHASGTHR
ncbi:MAG TPA: histidine kinase dimerization/phospho-acceptor domain-containing protein [Candidatus Eisenbacteria bacterium]|nr:histidine kinase dimerization/phospho-acceptor domain-containing protein [Candidatus Eisenbacteria bacterium]